VSVCVWRRGAAGLDVLELGDGDRWRLPELDDVDLPTTPVRGTVGHVTEAPEGFDPGVAHRWVGEDHAGPEVAVALRQCGAGVVVWRGGVDGPEVLLLHRAGRGDEDWAWTPPGGGLWPGELHHACAVRELREETGLVLDPVPVDHDGDFAVHVAELRTPTEIVLSDEHDRYEWLPVEDAVARCRPVRVGDSIRAAAREIRP
jgi:8-oxo-dGTP pyrophosphatase MutT (NUDIX family)